MSETTATKIDPAGLLEMAANLREHGGQRGIAVAGPAIVPREWLHRAADALEACSAQRDELLAALKELRALVRGECPSLLNEDSGGDARLDLAIEAAITKAEGR